MRVVKSSKLQKIKLDIFKNGNIIETQIEPFDKIFKGLSRGEITVVAACPSNCSKLFSAKLAYNIYVHQPVMIISGYSSSQIWLRDIMGLMTGKLIRDVYSELGRDALNINHSFPNVDLSVLVDNLLYLYDPPVETNALQLINDCFRWINEKNTIPHYR